MGRILVVDYSLTGNTRRAATALADACEARIVHIAEPRERSGWLAMPRAVWEVIRKRRPEIETERHDPAAFDLAVLATPVWVGSMASPMRSYIAEHRVSLPRVAFLCTQGGSGAEKAFDAMAGLCGRKPEATLVLGSADVKSGEQAGKIAGFAERLKAAADDETEGD